jgi:hypothetical protein
MIIEDIIPHLNQAHKDELLARGYPKHTGKLVTHEHTKEFVLAQVNDNPYKISRVRYIDEEVALCAVDKVPQTLAYIPSEYQSPRVCAQAVSKGDSDIISYVKEWTLDKFLAVYSVAPTQIMFNLPLGEFDESPLKIFIKKEKKINGR